MCDSYSTCLSKGSEGHSLLVLALRQQRDGDATADLLQLVGTLDGLADGPEDMPHSPPVLQVGAKLSGRNDHTRTSRLKQNGPDKGGSQPPLPPEREPHSGTPDRGERPSL